MWWLSLDRQFSLPFNEPDAALLGALADAIVNSAAGGTRAAELLGLDPRVLVLSASGYHHSTGRTASSLGQLAEWTGRALQNNALRLEPIRKRRRKLLRAVRKRRDAYLRQLRESSSAAGLRRQLERLMKECGQHSGKEQVRKLARRWLSPQLLAELGRVNPLDATALLLFSAKDGLASGQQSEGQFGGAVQIAATAPNRETAAASSQVQPPEPVGQAAQPNDFDFQQRLQAEKLAALRQLAYGASHEINNPLANIAMRAEMLVRGEADEERKRKLLVIRQQALRAHEMISDLMLFANPPRPAFQNLELLNWMGNLSLELRPDLELAGAELQLDCQVFQPVVADPVQLAEAVRALVRNAIEAQPKGAVIRLRAAGTPAGETWLEVRDNGPGISDQVARHMFDPFFSGREAGRGLGFGLPKAWRIAELHSGSLACASRSAGETTFRFTWPALKLAVKAA